MKLGGIDIVNPMIGTTPVTKIMAGDVLVWERGVSVVEMEMTDVGQDNGPLACGETNTGIRYRTDTGELIANGDIIYTSSTGERPFDGSDKWYTDSESDRAFQVDVNGVTSGMLACSHQ